MGPVVIDITAVPIHLGQGGTARHVSGPWTTWERHPLGAEVVIELTGGQALVNPPGVWQGSDSDPDGWIVTVTPGLGTEHRPR
jgi:hypothetical protein